MTHSTHTVLNQAAPRRDINEFTSHTALVEAIAQVTGAGQATGTSATTPQGASAPVAGEKGAGARGASAELDRIGELVGSAEFQHNAELANTITPVLQTHDRWGERIDEIEFHPAYHQIMGAHLAAGGHSYAWAQPGPGANVERASRFMLFSQIEPGHGCPVSMTHAAVPALRTNPELAEFWVPQALSTAYDPRAIDPAEKSGVTIGMAMTEKQGGSDVRANTTTARAIAGTDEYELTGHKWFCSAPQSDAFLMLAQLPAGVSCFLVPRVLPGGQRNGIQIQRLKDKLGNKSNASSEIELHDARGYLLGEPGRGVRTIIEMVNRTRLDCVLGSAAGMRQAVAEAVWHARHRRAFGSLLVEQPLMRAVIADLQLEAEAAVATAVHLAAAHDAHDADTIAYRRLATAVAKYWVCKRGPAHAYEALECLGGNGYTESFPLARRYREQPVNAVWEGSGNVIALDVLRAVARQPQSAKAFVAQLETGLGRVAAFDQVFEDTVSHFTAAAEQLRAAGNSEGSAEAALAMQARVLVERLALLLQATVLFEVAAPGVGESFVAARLGASRGHEYGALPDGVDVEQLVDRA